MSKKRRGVVSKATRDRDPWLVVMIAWSKGRGVTLTHREVERLANSTSFAETAMNIVPEEFQRQGEYPDWSMLDPRLPVARARGDE